MNGKLWRKEVIFRSAYLVVGDSKRLICHAAGSHSYDPCNPAYVKCRNDNLGAIYLTAVNVEQKKKKVAYGIRPVLKGDIRSLKKPKL